MSSSYNFYDFRVTFLVFDRIDFDLHEAGKKWWDAAKPYTQVPNVLIHHQGTLQIKPAEMCVLLAIMAHWHRDGYGNPFPSIERIAGIVGRTERQVIRTIKSLEDKEVVVNGVTFKGLVRVQRAPCVMFSKDSGFSQRANQYDFEPLRRILVAVLEHAGTAYDY